MIYTTKRCCLILKVLGTVQRRIFCYNYIHTILLDILYAIYKFRERSERSCQSSMVFDGGGVKLVAATRIFILRSISAQNASLVSVLPDATRLVLVLHHRTLNSAARRVATKLQKGQSKTFYMLLQRIMGRMSSNKISNTEIDSFPLYPNGSKEMEGRGKGRRNIIVFN